MKIRMYNEHEALVKAGSRFLGLTPDALVNLMFRVAYTGMAKGLISITAPIEGIGDRRDVAGAAVQFTHCPCWDGVEDIGVTLRGEKPTRLTDVNLDALDTLTIEELRDIIRRLA